MKTNFRRDSSPQPNSAWQKERASRLHRQFKRVEVARQHGKSVKAALSQFCRYWQGQHYRSNPAIKVHFSIQRLRALFYQWIRNGRSPEAVALKYRPANRRVVKRSEIARFVRHAVAPGTFTFAAAFATMQRTHPVSFSATHFFRALPAELSKQLRGFFLGRRHQRSIEARFKRSVAKGFRP